MIKKIFSLISLLLLVLTWSSYQASAEGNDSIIPKNTFPSPKQDPDLRRKEREPISATFYGDKNSDGKCMTVHLNEKFQISLLLPDDENNGQLSHMYFINGNAASTASLQHIINNDMMRDQTGNEIDYGDFYLIGGLHSSELQTGVSQQYCLVANQTGTYQVTFRFYEAPFVDLGQYQANHSSLQTITWNVTVVE